MRKTVKKWMALLLCALLLCTLAPLALADNGVAVTPGSTVFYESGGTLSMVVDITNDTDEDLELAAVQPVGGAIVSAVASGTVKAHSSKALTVLGTLSEDGSAVPGKLLFSFNTSTSIVKAECSGFQIQREYKEPTTPQKDETQTETPFALTLSRRDGQGYAVPTPEGEYGKAIDIRLPLVCREGLISNVIVSPVLDTDVEKFPFEIDLVDDSLSYPGGVGPGGVIEFQYHWTLSRQATKGVKKVDFNVSYLDGNGKRRTGTVSLFVNVTKGLEKQEEESDRAVPKVIVDSYTLSSDKIYAGETFTLDFTLRNTSARDTVRNLQVSVKEAASTATVLPASGGSNSLYVPSIGAGETKALHIDLQTSPAAEARAYTMSVDLSYEYGPENTTNTTSETITVPILQKIRIKCDDPVLYDDMCWVGQSSAMYLKMYNMGKSTVYNCQIDVEGQGLKMEESYFGGNLQSGAVMSADFNVIPSEAGTIDGTVLVTYEDVYGEISEIRLPFTMNVEDDSAFQEEEIFDGEMPMEPMPEQSAGLPWWVWALIGAAVVAVVLILLLRTRRKKRQRRLEED